MDNPEGKTHLCIKTFINAITAITPARKDSEIDNLARMAINDRKKNNQKDQNAQVPKPTFSPTLREEN